MNTILHGTWIKSEFDSSGYFLIWGEGRLTEEKEKKRGRPPKILRHPYAESSQTLRKIVSALSEYLSIKDFKKDFFDGKAVLTIPTVGKTPLPSRKTILEFNGKKRLYDCKVDVIYLSTFNAIKLLSSIPIHDYDLPCLVGEDFRFWSLSAKFVLHLISQQKFIPMLREDEDGKFGASWEPVLDDSEDAEKLNKLISSMPDACRSVKSVIINKSGKQKTTLELSEYAPKQLVVDFLYYSIDLWVRNNAEPNFASKISKNLKDKAAIIWLKALVDKNRRFEAPDLNTELKKISESLANWGRLGKTVDEKFRVCFRLESPENKNEKWSLRYFLQAIDDPSLLVPANLVWKEQKNTLKYLNREFESPQERLLEGLGIASRIFPVIEKSLRQAKPMYCPLKAEEAYQFLNETSLLLQQSGFGVIAPSWWTDKKSQIKVKVQVSSPKTEGKKFFSLDSVLQYNWELALGDKTITAEELEQIAKLKVPLVQMRGEWVLLRPEDIKAAVEVFNKQGKTGELSLREAIHLNLSETNEFKGIKVDVLKSDGWLDSLVKDLKEGSLKKLKQPKDFVGKLRPYQLLGLSWLSFMRKYALGACLADDMGLGKTIEVIALLLREKKLRGKNSQPNLLICPTSVVGNWKKEAQRFAPSLKVIIHHGSDRLFGDEFVNSITEYDLVITSYGLARRDIKELTSVNWKGVILDEAQNIKNPSSKTAQSIRKLGAEYRFALTGTPIENRLMELWSIMEFLNPGYLWSRKKFQENFVLPIERYGNEIATKELKSIISPFILRRLKTDPKIISDLPEKIEMKVYCNLTREQVTLYEAVVKDMLQQFEEDEDDNDGGIDSMKRRGMVLSALMKLKQLCNH